MSHLTYISLSFNIKQAFCLIFVEFLKENMSNLKSEFFIPLIVNDLIQTKRATVTVLDTPSKWFGVTYAQDRPDVVAKIQSLVDAGEYPTPLF